jgi:hypothetical protein
MCLWRERWWILCIVLRGYNEDGGWMDTRPLGKTTDGLHLDGDSSKAQSNAYSL